MSKKVVFQCIDFLIGTLTQVNIEGIVILLEKFGTSINKPDSKIKKEELSKLNEKIEIYLVVLDKMREENKNLPGFIKYKIINLREKKKRGWVESKVDESLKIKTKREVGDEFDQEQRDKGKFLINKSGNNYRPQNNYDDYDENFQENYTEEPAIKKDSDDHVI